MRILLITAAIAVSLLIAGCGGASDTNKPQLEIGSNMPMSVTEKEVTFTIKNVGDKWTPGIRIRAIQAATEALDIYLTDLSTGDQLQSTGLNPVEYIPNSCRISFDGVNWSVPKSDLLLGFNITNLEPSQLFTLKFLRK